MSDYWKMVVTEALETIDCLRHFDETKLSSLAAGMGHAADMQGEACGWPGYQVDSKPPSELDKLKKELERERNSTGCVQCLGSGRVIDYGPHHSSDSACCKCRGRGKIYFD